MLQPFPARGGVSAKQRGSHGVRSRLHSRPRSLDAPPPACASPPFDGTPQTILGSPPIPPRRGVPAEHQNIVAPAQQTTKSGRTSSLRRSSCRASELVKLAQQTTKSGRTFAFLSSSRCFSRSCSCNCVRSARRASCRASEHRRACTARQQSPDAPPPSRQQASPSS